MTISTPKATPATLSLRLKFHRTTVLLHADPLLSSSALQSDLLHALRDTHPNNTLHGRPLPASPAALQIARLVDPTDAEQGWVEIIGSGDNEEDMEAEEEAPRKKGPDGRPSTSKGKGTGKGAAANNNNNNNNNNNATTSTTAGAAKSLKELGVKDGMALAFRWAGEVQRDGDVEVLEWEDWDVQWPRYEDTYGLEDEGIVG